MTRQEEKVQSKINSEKDSENVISEVITNLLYGTLEDMNFKFMTFAYSNQHNLHTDSVRALAAGYDIGMNGSKLLVYLPEGFSC